MSRDTTLPILVGNHIQTMTSHITSNNILAETIAVIASSNELQQLQYWSQLPPPQKRLSKGMRNSIRIFRVTPPYMLKMQPGKTEAMEINIFCTPEKKSNTSIP